jgi:hypothetical protein
LIKANNKQTNKGSGFVKVKLREVQKLLKKGFVARAVERG